MANPVGGQLAAATNHSVTCNEVGAFVDQVAALSLWSYDDKDGNPYRECKPPSNGYLDSHCCLMDLIEQARSLSGGPVA